jgi:hypothetical protein
VKDFVDPPAIVCPAEDLAALANQINAEHEAAEGAVRKSLEHARAAGDALLRARQKCKHGEWLPWLRANVRFSQQTAWGYTRIAREWGKLPTVGNLTLREALSILGRDDEAVPDEGGDETGSDEAPIHSPEAGSVNSVSPAEWTPCREHRGSNTRYSECVRCRALNAENTPPCTTKPKNNTKPDPGGRSTEPEPPPWIIAVGKAKKASDSLVEQTGEICRMLALPAPRKAALRQSVDVVSEVCNEAANCAPVPLGRPYSKNCKKCGKRIILAMKEDRGWIALEEAKKGAWDIIADMACVVTGGPYRFHGISCKQYQASCDEPIQG